MRKYLLISVLFLTSYFAVAQANYVVTLKADTLRGDVRILSYDNIDRVQVAKDGKKESFTALEVLILYLDNNFYKAVKHDNKVVMMKVIKSGYLSLFAFRLPNMSSYDGRFLLKMDGNSMEMPNLGFKKVMASFVEDCLELSAEIKKGTLGKSKIEQIIDEYNACVDSRTVHPAAPVIEEGAKVQLDAIKKLADKINELSFDTKQDALDILRDIQSKVEKKENVSNYQIEGLQSTLKEQPSVAEELNHLVGLFKK
jgi:hypothetical protein